MSGIDPILILAKQRIISASAELEVELKASGGSRPTLEIMKALRKRADIGLIVIDRAPLNPSGSETG